MSVAIVLVAIYLHLYVILCTVDQVLGGMMELDFVDRPVDLMILSTLCWLSTVESTSIGDVGELIDPVAEAIGANLLRGRCEVWEIGEAILRPIIQIIAAKFVPVEVIVDGRLDRVSRRALGEIGCPVCSLIVIVPRRIRLTISDCSEECEDQSDL